MSFLQPWLLVGLPLISLPIIIHLVNQRRYQTLPWGAMQFLLSASRMSRGYARLRRWLILAMRVLAVAALVLAVSRPLAGGWLGWVGGSGVDTALILLDRSPSMSMRGPSGSLSKLETARAQLARTLKTLPRSRWILIDGVRREPMELADPEDLLSTAHAGAVSSSTDLPDLLQLAHKYIVANQSPRNDIWICSDLRREDWDVDGGRWPALRDALAELPPGTRIHLLAYPESAADDSQIRVTRVVRQDTRDGAELLISLIVERESLATDQMTVIPVRFELEGARSSLDVELVGPRAELKDHRIPLDKGLERGWGRVSIPADANTANNDFYFAFGPSLVAHTLIVAGDPLVARPLQLAAEISPDGRLKPRVEVVSQDELGRVPGEDVGLLIWQETLPEGKSAEWIEALVKHGGTALFLPPRNPNATSFMGLRWEAWKTPTNELNVTSWRGDADLLAHTNSGAALPLGSLRVRRYCSFSGDATELARLGDGGPFLVRLPGPLGAVYACGTTPRADDSSLAGDGVVLYVAIQRALALGSARLEGTRQINAGTPGYRPEESWKRLAGDAHAISTQFPHHAGVFATDDRLLAVNRSATEDRTAVVSDEELAALFQGLEFSRINDRIGGLAAVIEEIWRPVLLAMLAALLAEALLCIPRPIAGTAT